MRLNSTAREQRDPMPTCVNGSAVQRVLFTEVPEVRKTCVTRASGRSRTMAKENGKPMKPKPRFTCPCKAREV